MAARLLSTRRLTTSHSLCKYHPSLSFRSYANSPTDVKRNPFRVQSLHPKLHDQLFPPQFAPQTSPENVDIALQHLRDQALNLEKVTPLPSASFDLPPLVGNTIQEHFWNIGKDQVAPFYDAAKELAAATLPPKPTQWRQVAGWTRYDTKNSKIEAVPYPLEESIVFDTEVMYNVTKFPAIATAVSAKAWYGWVSPDVISGDSTFTSKELIPLGPTYFEENALKSGARVVVGHNIGFDRARVADEYNVDAPKRAYLDTFSLHVAGVGTTPRYNKDGSSDDDQWAGSEGDMKSLKDLARFYLNENLLKTDREMFATTSVKEIQQDFEKLMTYCATDVQITARVYTKVLPTYFQRCPHPVSFAGIIHMGQSILPVNRGWKRYINEAEAIFQDRSQKLEDKMRRLAEEALTMKEEHYRKDPWLRHLDWTKTKTYMTKETYDKHGNVKKPSVPYARTRASVKYPAWYKGLLKGVGEEKKLQVGFRTRAAPYLLRLKWQGFPIYYSQGQGWCFRVGANESKEKIPASATSLQFLSTDGKEPASATDHHVEKEGGQESKPDPKKSYDDYAARDIQENGAQYFRIPHVDGEKYKCGSPLAANFMISFEEGVLTSEIDFAKEILQGNLSLSYWAANRERICNQFVVWNRDKSDMKSAARKSLTNTFKSKSDRFGAIRRDDEKEIGFILPKMITMGTVTRRAVEPTWLTASNPKHDRVGSELKAMVCAPPGYKIVGADVDSEELWIFAALGDAQFKAHGSTALGWMVVQGTKADGTDMHSKTANILGVDRGKAKQFNYSRIYGAGKKFTSNLLARHNPAMGKKEADLKAKELFKETKGTRMKEHNRYTNTRLRYGGSESYSFNSVEYIAENNPRTPVLDCKITDALDKRFEKSRYNWVVQSSGVDYLHLLLVAFSHISRKHNINSRYMISLHDEVRYLVVEKDVHRAALALQIANLWTRSLFCARFGIHDLPEAVAFFSAVDVDHVMRKEVDHPCTSPSQEHPIPAGTTLDIFQTLEHSGQGLLGPPVRNDPTKHDVPLEHSGISETLLPPNPLILTIQRCLNEEEVQREAENLGSLNPEQLKK